MAYKRWRVVLVLLALAAISLGCSMFESIVANLDPQPTPTLTPGLTPTPSATPTRALPASFAAIVEALAPVMEGQGVAGAGSYEANQPGPHPLVILDFEGTAHVWNHLLPGEWTPSALDEVELVILVAEHETSLGSQSYVGGPAITRYRRSLYVELREAHSGQLLNRTTLAGSDPAPFPALAPMAQLRIVGGQVSYWQLQQWLTCEGTLPLGVCVAWHILMGHAQPVNSVAFAPDGQLLASASGTLDLLTSAPPDNTVRLWRIRDGAHLRALEGHTGPVTDVAFAPDGQTLASASGDGTVRLWQVADGAHLRTLVGHPDAVNSVAFAPDGSTLASGGDTVRLWRVSDGALLRTLDGHTDWITGVAFSPDGQTLATTSLDHTVRLWQVSDGALLRVLEGHTDEVLSVAFAPDGQTLATGASDQTIRVWRVADGALVRSLDGATAPVYSVAYSPDGRFLASSNGITVQLWRATDGSPIQALEGHTMNVNCIAFSPDGQLLASGSGIWFSQDAERADNSVRLWRMEGLEGH